jgi:hypothetical protein
MIRKIVMLSLLAAAIGSAGTAHAEYRRYYYYQYPWDNPYTRTHFYLGGSGVGVVVLDQTGPNAILNHGGGFSLFLGVRFARFFALEAGWQPTFHNTEFNQFGQPVSTIGLQSITGDFKFYPARGPVQPYFSIGAGAYLLGDNFSVFAEGPGYQIGGGVDFFVSPWFSVGLRIQYRGVELFDYDPRNDNTYLSMLNLGVDLTGHF